MENMEAVRALSALGHESRLAIFRVLVQVGPEGLAAGEIARRLDLAPNALTFHLKDLTNAGLAESRQSGRFVIYSAVFPVMASLVAYLTENCCSGLDCAVPSTPPSSSRSKPRIDNRKAARVTRLPAKSSSGRSRNSTVRSSK